MAAIAAAAIAGGVGLIGDVMSQSGQQNTNAQNMAIAQMNNQFNAQQAQLNRNFQSWQAATAEQTRVADLKAAGLNPLLAAGNPAQAMSGATASSAGNPQMQNPASAFQNLGSQAQSAMQVASNIQLQSAQTAAANAAAKKTISETPSGSAGLDSDGNPIVTVGDNHDLGDANVKSIQAVTAVNQAQALQVKANIDLINAQVRSTDSTAALNTVNSLLQGQNLEVLKATKQYLIQQQAAAGAGARNMTDLQQSNVGRVLTYINALLAPVTSAVGAAKGTGLIPSVGYGGRAGPMP